MTNTIKFIRFNNGRDVIAEVVQELETEIMLQSPMEMVAELDYEGGKQVLIMYPWIPAGVVMENQVSIKTSDVMIKAPVDDNIKSYYTNVCKAIFNSEQKLSDPVTKAMKEGNVLLFNGSGKTSKPN